MPEFFKKQWIFFILTVLAVFFVAFSHNIFSKTTEILGQIKFFSASVSSVPIIETEVQTANSLDDQPPEETELILEEPVVQPLTQEEIQEQLDDIAEKIDILKQEVAELAGNPVVQQAENTDLENTDLKVNDEENLKLGEEKVQLAEQPVIENNVRATNSGSGGGGKPSYPKILISEVQAAGQEDKKQEFVELYNLNGFSVELTGWYLQRKTAGALSGPSSWSTYASNSLFSNKTISANGYFLIAREGYYSGPADIFTDNPITDDNSFALKNPNGDISDKLGFGQAQDPELLPTVNPGAGQSIGRKALSDGTEEETDNNLNDFELQTPTPRAKNIVFVEPPPAPADTTAPQVVFNLNAAQDNLSFLINFEITDILDVVTPSGIDSYIFRWKEGENDWQEDSAKNIDGALESYSGARDFTGEDGKIYYFQIKVKDVAGNESSWLPVTPAETKIEVPIPVEVKAIVINEVQTEGQTVKDEFVEFYNPNDFDDDLADFSLKKKTSGGSESNLVSSGKFAGVIPAIGYFLIAPQLNDDGTPNYTGSAVPDLYYSGKTYSIASNNTVLLYDKNDNLLDKVGFGSASDFETTPAPNPDKNQSIKRTTSGLDTDDNGKDFAVSDAPTPRE